MKKKAQKNGSDTVPGLVLRPNHIKVFQAIEKYIAKHVYSPEVGEIGDELKLNWRQVTYYIDQLCQMGHLSKQYRIPRSLKIEKPIK